MATKSHSFTFVNLPNEVRFAIYTFLLNHSERLYIAGAGLYGWNAATRSMTTSSTVFGIYSAILSTCRRIHDEASPLLYNGNIFHFDGRTSFAPFLDKIGLRHTLEIRAAAISCWTSNTLLRWDLGSMWKSFRRLANLQTLHILVFAEDYGTPEILAKVAEVISLATALVERHPSLRTGDKMIVRCSEPSHRHFSVKLVSSDYEHVPRDTVVEFEMEAALILNKFGGE